MENSLMLMIEYNIKRDAQIQACLLLRSASQGCKSEMTNVGKSHDKHAVHIRLSWMMQNGIS